MKALLIDPEKKEISEIEYSGETLDIYKFIECRTNDLEIWRERC